MNGHMFDVEQAERSSSEEEQKKGNAFNRFFKVGQNTGAQAVTEAKGWTVKAAEKLEDFAFWYDKKVERMNTWAESSKMGKFFTIKDRRSKFSTELRAGTISFLMIAYVLAVNPSILEATGGQCDAEDLCSAQEYKVRGSSCLFVSKEPAAQECLSQLRLSLITATAVASLVSSFIMGFFANLPMGLAPGMGVNIYLAYQVVAQEQLTYEQAMVAIFLEGFIFIILSMTGVRGGIMRYMPPNIAFAGSVGIGLLLAFTGLRNLGVIVFDGNTLVTLGGCPPEGRNYVFQASTSLLPENISADAELSNVTLFFENMSIIESASDVYSCSDMDMRSATMWLGIAGGIIMSLLSVWRVKGALFIGVAFVTIISWIPGHAASFLGEGSAIPGGEYRMDVFKQVVGVPTLSGTAFAWDWSAVGKGEFWLVLLTLLYIDILDCTGILISMAILLDDCMKHDAEERNEPYAPFISEKKEFKGQQWAFLADGFGIVLSSMLGISPVNVYLESAAGIEEGGRTGIVPMIVSFLFFVSLFFSPIFSSIPPYATGPALILVGVMLIAHVDHIQWDDSKQAIPAFLAIVLMPFTLSVAYGVIGGLVLHIILHLPGWLKLLYDKFIAPYFAKSSDGDSDDGRAMTTSSQNRAQLKKKAVHRKVFGQQSFRGSDDGSVLSYRGGRQLGLDDQVRIASSAIETDGSRRPVKSSSFHPKMFTGTSPGKSQAPFVSGESSPRSDAVDKNVASRALRGSTSLGLTRSRTFADLASAAVEQSRQERMQEKEEKVQLFGDFQLLDLDLGSSGSSSGSDDEEKIRLQTDGSLVLSKSPDEGDNVHSIDMSMFNTKTDSQEEPALASQFNMTKHSKPYLEQAPTLSIDTHDVGESSRLRRLGTSTSFDNNLGRAFDGSPQKQPLAASRSFGAMRDESKSMPRMQSDAAFRLKSLFEEEDEEESKQPLPGKDDDSASGSGS